MPGYYDWKMLNCPQGAIAKANSLINTLSAVDPHLIEIWEANGKSFPPEINAKLQAVVDEIDEAEDCLEKAKVMLAEFFPGHPAVVPKVKTSKL